MFSKPIVDLAMAPATLEEACQQYLSAVRGHRAAELSYMADPVAYYRERVIEYAAQMNYWYIQLRATVTANG